MWRILVARIGTTDFWKDRNFTFPGFSHVLVELRVSLVEQRVKSKFVCKEASFFVLKSLFFAEKIQKRRFLAFIRAYFRWNGKNPKIRTKMFDLEVFLYGFCNFDTISTKAIERWLLAFWKLSKTQNSRSMRCHVEDVCRRMLIFSRKVLKDRGKADTMSASADCRHGCRL